MRLTMSASQRGDLQALVEIYLLDGASFGELSKEIRAEFNLTIRQAVEWTIEGLRLAYEAHERTQARAMAVQWHMHVHRELPAWLSPG